MTPADRAAIMTALREEMRVLGLFDVAPQPALPPPSDLPAEGAVISGCLDGQLRPSETGLRPTWFWRPANGAAFEALCLAEQRGVAMTEELLGRALVAQGATPTAAADYLLGLRAEPVRYRIGEQVDRVRVAARRRALVRDMQAIDAALRLGLELPPKTIERAIALLGKELA